MCTETPEQRAKRFIQEKEEERQQNQPTTSSYSSSTSISPTTFSINNTNEDEQTLTTAQISTPISTPQTSAPISTTAPDTNLNEIKNLLLQVITAVNTTNDRFEKLSSKFDKLIEVLEKK